jgi:hypothetical protein
MFPARRIGVMARMMWRALAGVFALSLAIPNFGTAQEVTAIATDGGGSAQLAAILAPVALYPDPVLSNILAASTYPLEVVEAARWVADPVNADLTGDALLAALQQKDWDPTVKSLVPFPPILKLMNDQLEWTQQLGNAFLAQQGAVMDTVQSLRRQAQSADGLVSTPQQIVRNDEGSIEIQPANSQQVAIPAYDPSVVYGTWPYPEAPPAAFTAYEPGDYNDAYAGGWFFGPPVVLIEPVWFWGRFDWRDHRLAMDGDRLGRLNPHRGYVANSTWQHDPAHRRGVAYHDGGVQQHFQPGGAPSPHRLPMVFTGDTSNELRAQSAPPRMPGGAPPAVNRPPVLPATAPRQGVPVQAPVRPPVVQTPRPIVPGQYRVQPMPQQQVPVLPAQYAAPAARPQAVARPQGQPVARPQVGAVAGEGRPAH